VKAVIGSGVLEGAELQSLRDLVLQILSSCEMVETQMVSVTDSTHTDEGHCHCFECFEKSSSDLLLQSALFGEAMSELPETVKGRASFEILLVESFLDRALRVFQCWSLHCPAPYFRRFLQDFASPQTQVLVSLSGAGAHLLSGLLTYNDRLRQMVWKSAVFKNALRETVVKLRPTPETAECLKPYLNLLVGCLPCAEEDIEEMNKKGGPLNYGHLLRAVLWLCKAEHGGRPSFVSRWSDCSSQFGCLGLWDQRDPSFKSAFSGVDANEDAMELFLSAVSGFEGDGDPNAPINRQSSHPPEGESLCYRRGRGRSLAIEATLNPAVCAYVYRESSALLEKMLRLREALRREGLNLCCFDIFIAWLESQQAADGATVNSFIHQLPAAFFKRIPPFSLMQVLQTAVKQIAEGLGRPVQTTAFGSRAKRREERPPPCATCGARVASYKFCAKCKLLVYCGTECQKVGWKGGHKGRCAQYKANVFDVLD